MFIEQLRKAAAPTATPSTPCPSLTITSNVMYGKKTGTTPDGRKARRAAGPGRQPDARPRYQRRAGFAELRWPRSPYRRRGQDGISNTFSIVPQALGKDGAGAG